MVTPRRLAVFNDTSAGGHYGCAAVMSAIDAILENAGGKVIYRHPVGVEWRDHDDALAAMQAADIVIVNGEGSIHRGKARAEQLSAIGPHCKSIGTPSFLINTTVQENGPEIHDNIRSFDHVWVRESRSAAELSEAGISNSICADLSLTCKYPMASHTRSGFVVVDSIVQRAVRQLATYAAEGNTPLLVMKRNEAGDILGTPPERIDVSGPGAAPQTPLFSCPSYKDFAQHLGEHQRMITGRFHSVCFAISMRLPFHAFASNTHKIESTLLDAGLDANRMLSPEAPLPSRLPFSPIELDAIEDFIARTEDAAAEMALRMLA